MRRLRSIALALVLGTALFAVSQGAPTIPIFQNNPPSGELALRSTPPAKLETGKHGQEAKPLIHTLSIEQKKQKGRKWMSLHYPDGWREIPSQYANAYELQNSSNDKLNAAEAAEVARLLITVEDGRSHADAVRRLKEIAAEVASPATFLSIGGWPAMQRQHLALRERVGETQRDDEDRDGKILKITTAIAVDNTLVRIEARLPAEADPAIAAQVEAIGRSAEFTANPNPTETEREIETLRRSPSLRTTPFPAEPAAPKSRPPAVLELEEKNPEASLNYTPIPRQSLPTTPGGAINVLNGTSELEVTASNDGRNIIVAAGRNFATSNDGGRTFPFTGGLPFSNFGDVSIAFGQSGNFYFAGINNTAGCTTTPLAGCATGINVSTNNTGRTFTFRSNAVACATSGSGLCFPDQEHIAADRFNPGTMAAQDQVYSVWRNFAPSFSASIVCSSDSATNWTAPAVVDSGGDFPRVTVGQDGTVYVAYVAGGNIMIRRFSSCRTGLTPQPAQMVASFSNIVCPLPGLDRCNDGNVLASPTAAVDDTNASHIYVAYATNTAANNDDVMVHHSTDGGATWSAGVRVNAATPSRRFMPWITVTGGVAYVSWYDRRAAVSGATNDLTDFFRGSVSVSGGGLVAGPEVKITQAADPQCASGWPCQTRNTSISPAGDSESCTVQPQLAGICKINPVPMPDTSSNRACDFSTCPGPMCPCNAGEICQGGGGCPKYGDYNGIGAANGRVIVAWASATAPLDITPAPPAGINVYTQTNIVCCVPQIQIPSNPNFPSTCVGTMSKATLNVCNTGEVDLEVKSITSSSGQFTITNPSAGFPVLVGPNSCFPFEVAFMPTGTGPQTTTLTVTSNDPVNPTVTRTVTAQGDQPRLATIVADAGNFGEVCVSKFKDLDITINNAGGCDLRITSISSSSAEFQTAGVISFPLVIHSGDSLEIPFRFQPTSFGNKSAIITFNSNDPASPKTVNLSGVAPTATIVVNDPIIFDNTCPGNTNNKTLTIGNSGGCDLIVTGITSSSPEFKVVGVVPFPLVIPPGSTRDVTIQFMPMGFNMNPVHMATLTIMSNDLNTPNKMVTVKGTVPPPIIQVMPDPLDFGKVCLGKSKDLPLTIKNTGDCNLTISNITSNSPEFTLPGLPAFPIVIPPGGMRDITVRFTPASTGMKMGLITISSDDPATPSKQVVVKGEAPISAIAISGPTDWGDVTVGKFKDMVINITNTEACDLAITLVCEIKNGVPQLPSTEFNVVTPLSYPVIIPGGGTLPVIIRFKPEKKGLRTATLLVFGYDPQTPTIPLTATTPLKGTGK